MLGCVQYLPTEGPRLPAVPESEFAGEAVRFAIEHLSEREAAFSRRDALVQALRAARGAATSQAITRGVGSADRYGRPCADSRGSVADHAYSA